MFRYQIGVNAKDTDTPDEAVKDEEKSVFLSPLNWFSKTYILYSQIVPFWLVKKLLNCTSCFIDN